MGAALELEAFGRHWDQVRSGVARFRPWFVLCRMPQSLTAAADPLAGALVAGAGPGQLPFAITLMLGVFFLHAGAVVLNDWHDFKSDRVENPDRPLAAGHIGRWYGLFGAVVLLSAGLTLTSVPGPRSAQMGLGLLAAILLYEFIMKGAPAGKAVPAIARALALLMGAMLVPAEGQVGDWSLRAFCMCVLGTYVLGATVVGQRPPDQYRRAFAVAGASVMGLAVLALAFMRLFLPAEAAHPSAAVWIGLLAVGLGVALGRAIMRPAEATLRTATWAALLGTILLDATMVAFVRNLAVSLPVAALLLPVFYVRRLLESPGTTAEVVE